MRSIQGISIIGVGVGFIIIIGVIAGTGGIVTSNERPPIGQAPPITENTTATTEREAVTYSQSVSDTPQTYAVTAHSADAIKLTQLAKYGEVGTQAEARVELTMSPADVATVQNISWVTNVRPVIRPEPAQTSTETNTDIPGSSNGSRGSLGVQQAHQNGITGDGVKVGVIDVGFAPDNPAIASNVATVESFRSSQASPAHGTSVAEIVTQTAPDSQLYLASVETATDIKAAIDSLTSQDVDIIVHSQGIPSLDDDGDHTLSDDINAATASGTLFINAAGNAAQTHWEGKFRDDNGNGSHEWTQSGDELNCLDSCDTDYSGDVTVYVRWSDQGQVEESHYRPSLFNPETDEYIAIDRDGVFRTPTGTKYTQLSVTDISSQPVDLVVDRVSGPAGDTDKIEVIVSSGPQSLERNVPESSIGAPADVKAALTVAAYERERSRLAPYSSRGPTDDGRNGIDVTGYTNIEVTNDFYGTGIFRGTSAAAPYVGGVAALIEENQLGDQPPAEVTQTLTSSSDDIRDIGVDTASGSGVINVNNAIDETKTSPELTASASPTTIDPTDTNVTTVTFEVTNTGETSEQATVNISADSLPQGLTLDSVTGTDPTAPDQSAVIPNQRLSTVSFNDISSGETVTTTVRVKPTPDATETTVIGSIQAIVEYDRDGEMSVITTVTANLTVADQDSNPKQDIVAEYAGDDGEVDSFDVIAAINDFRRQKLNPFEVLEIIRAFRGS